MKRIAAIFGFIILGMGLSAWAADFSGDWQIDFEKSDAAPNTTMRNGNMGGMGGMMGGGMGGGGFGGGMGGMGGGMGGGRVGGGGTVVMNPGTMGGGRTMGGGGTTGTRTITTAGPIGGIGTMGGGTGTFGRGGMGRGRMGGPGGMGGMNSSLVLDSNEPVVIKQTDAEIRIVSTYDNNGQKMPVTEVYQLDGKKHEGTVQTYDGGPEVPRITKASLSKNKIKVEITIRNPEGKTKITKEFNLSKDGKELTLKSTTSAPRFLTKQKLVFYTE